MIKEVEDLIQKYNSKENVTTIEAWPSMIDNKTAEVNYAIVREYKPKVVVEYGTHKGRCTHDILKALIANGKKYVFKAYESDPEARAYAQNKLDSVFGEKFITIGDDIMLAKDIPTGIDYLFLDHSHQEALSKWTWENMIPRVKKGGVIMIHDMPIGGDYGIGKGDHFPELDQIVEMHRQGTLPFEKLFWLYDDYSIESSWWTKI